MAHNGTKLDLLFNMIGKSDFSKYNKGIKSADSATSKFQKSINMLKKTMGAIAGLYITNKALNGVKQTLTAISGITIPDFSSLVTQSIEVSKNFADAEAKLKALLVHTKSIGTSGAGGAASRLINLAATTESKGVVAQEVLESGLQQMSTFQLSEQALTALTPLMADLLAQQYGTDATQDDAVNIANLIGKGMSGMTGALTRVGIVMDDQQKALIQNGDDQTKLNTMVEVLTQNVGGVNEYLANYTAAGKEANFQFQIAAMMREWGDRFMEMRIQILSAIKPYLPVLKRIMDAVISVVGAIISGVVNWISKHGSEIQAIADSIAIRIEDFASSITPSRIEGWVSNLFTTLDDIKEIIKNIALGLAIFQGANAITAGISGFSLRSQLPKNITSGGWSSAVTGEQLLAFTTLNTMRNAGGGQGLGSKAGARLAKLLGFTTESVAEVAEDAAVAATKATASTNAFKNSYNAVYDAMGLGTGKPSFGGTVIRNTAHGGLSAAEQAALSAEVGAATGTAGASGGLMAKLSAIGSKILAFLQPAGLVAIGVIVAAGLNKWIKDTFGSGEALGKKLADIVKKAVSFIYNLLLDFFGADNLPSLLVNIIRGAVEFIFDTLPGILTSFAWELISAIPDAIRQAIFGPDEKPLDLKGEGSTGRIGESALGTPYSHGTTTINERGGEIMRLPNGTTIIPADKSEALLSGGRPSINITVAGNLIGNKQYMEETAQYIWNQVQLAYAAG